ncbi:MAG: response regulator [Sneathiellaceae bacterium]
MTTGSGTDAGAPGRLRILLVEDDAMIRWSTADMLSDLGHEVVEAGDTAAALAALADGPIDILLTDIGLPDRPGNELAAEARQQRSQIGIVFASGRDEMPDQVLDMPGSSPVLLVKPYDETQLSKALSAALSG